MRRPPDTQPPTSLEVASSNSTANAFLGGKQKSWMTAGASTTVRPTPRDPARTSTNSTSIQRNSTATVLPSPAPSDEPSPIQPQTESPAAEVPSEPMHQAPPQQPQPLQQQPQPLQQQQQPQQRPQQPVHRQPLAPSPRTQLQENLNPNIVQNAAQAQHQNKRMRTLPPNHNSTMSSTPSLIARIAMIDEHIRASGIDNLNPSIEKPRFQLLRDACRLDDFFYVALHQIFCIWTINQNALLAVPGLPDHETLSTAFKILSQLIRDNNALTHCHLEWFTQFPAPLENLMASSDIYQQNLANVGVFLRKLRTDWTTLTIRCQERGYPPLCDELVESLNLLSPILQNVFFTATRRNLNVSDDHYGHSMENLFVMDRRDFGNLASRMNTDRPPTQKEMTQRRSKLIADYLKLYREHQAQRNPEDNRQRPLRSVPVQPNPAPPSNGAIALSQHARSNSYSQLPTAVVHHYTAQESNPPAHGQNAFVSPYASPRLMQSPDPRIMQYDGNHSPHLAQMAPGYSPSSSNGYGYMPPTPVLASSVASPVDRNYPSGHFPTPQYAAQQQQFHATQQPAQQNGQWAREFNQSHDQDQRIRQVLLQQQNAQLQQQQFQTRHQNMMQQRQSHPTVGSVPNSGRMGSRQSSIVHQYPQNANAYPTLVSTPTQGIRKDEGIPFIPPVGAPPPGQPANPDLTALHQAHVRSPRLLTAGLLNSRAPQTPEERFYQAIKDFVIHPTALPIDMPLSRYEFGLTEATCKKVARTLWPGPGALATRNVSGGSLQYRFRCVQLGPDHVVPNENDWITADTKWPEVVFVEVNGNALELRRKSHHGKDYPVDITTFVKPSPKSGDDANTVRISFPRRKRHGEPHYAFAVEVIEVLQHKAITDMILKTQRIPGSETLNNIVSKLSVSLDDDDDEIAMVASDLTIDLADPFTAKMFETPVRGVTCLHRECFDLQTFLVTRNSKPRRPEQPCMVDVWKCPLCGKDARPYSLRVDEFLLSVRTSLAEQGLLDCKAILVSTDGAWKPKPEPKPNNRNKRNSSAAGMDEDDEDDENENGNGKTPAPSKASKPEVIELDSD